MQRFFASSTFAKTTLRKIPTPIRSLSIDHHPKPHPSIGPIILPTDPDPDPSDADPTDRTVDEFSADVERVYRLLRRFHTRLPQLELALSGSGVSVRPGLVERVLSRCGDSGNLGFSFFSWASKQPGYRPSTAIYKSTVRMLGKMRQFNAAWGFVDDLRREKPELITPEIFVVLMRRFASARMVDKAIDLLDEMPKYGCETDERVFGCLLDALCKNGSVREASKLYEDMRERFPPRLKHFTSLLYGWCRAGKLIEAKVVLARIREAGLEPDVVVYNNLLGGYAAAGEMEKAFELLKEMLKTKNCVPNAVSYTVLIQALCGGDRTDEAMRVFVEMRRDGCVADVVTYNALITGFCRQGKIRRGYEILEGMIQQGLFPNPASYFPIMAAHEKNEELEECLELVSEIAKAGFCVPDLSIYNTVIRLACKLGELEAAAKLWNDIESSRLSPSIDSYVIIINGFLAQGALIEACSYFREMVAQGLCKTSHYGLVKVMLNSLLRAEKLELAKEMWDAMANRGCEPNVNVWTIWLHALFTCGHVKDACRYCMEMMERGVMPQPDTFAKLMKGLKKLYNRHIAVEVTEKVKEMAAERGTSFKIYKRRGEKDLADKLKAKAKKGRTKRP
ncbi:putative pentatricopeptide repeat-containing protein [Acorus gramineus]|uniref:Pentatricopeptide repeat-containing protein n=1 Tax=Acorus gramineus TaxID=55184 RepID=A0AAV9BL89_ACOGR|nr:putative pentatricopeptide repeat-containing protein [Acorus gramineus]